jgi:diadenosine tetraphosphate (Ap4A) HIT family hydrolase
LCAAIEDPSSDGYRIYEDQWWSAGIVPGIGPIVLQTCRHVEGVWDLDDEEAAAMGNAIVRVASAIRQDTNAEKVYVVGMGETHAHVHAILIGRPSDLPLDQRGLALVQSRLTSGPSPGTPDPSEQAVLASLRSRLARPAGPSR